jgi:YHS domain-containing protein
MRTAVDDLQGALRQLRALLGVCAGLQAASAADMPAGHVTPGGQQMPNTAQTPPAAPGTAIVNPGSTAPAAPMDHSKMPMGGTPAAKPGAATGTKSVAPAAPMDHSKMPMDGAANPGKVMDPVNGLMVDPATAPNTTYQGQTYYFSSLQSRKEFLVNPAKFAKKPKG